MLGLRSFSALSLTIALALGCGEDETKNRSGSDNTTSAGGSTSSQGGGGTMMVGPGGTGGTGGGGMVMVPPPGDMQAFEWPDTEPNDTPGQATPVGVFEGALWMGFSMPPSAIDPEDDIDFYVFKMPATVQVFTDLAVCYSFAGNLLDLYLYDVQNGFLGPEIASATETTGGCETLMTIAEAQAALQPDATYVLEVRHGPGLVLGGDPGLYSA
jgi:hypothetical protein